MLILKVKFMVGLPKKLNDINGGPMTAEPSYGLKNLHELEFLLLLSSLIFKMMGREIISKCC